MEMRLNSPRDKFKITNMEEDRVGLTPEDIPILVLALAKKR